LPATELASVDLFLIEKNKEPVRSFSLQIPDSADGTPLFSSEAAAATTVDRLVERATILRFAGDSFRKAKTFTEPSWKNKLYSKRSMKQVVGEATRRLFWT